MKRTLQLIGLLLIAVLSTEYEAAGATYRLSSPKCGDEVNYKGCLDCYFPDGCYAWACPIGHPDGIGIRCPGPD